MRDSLSREIILRSARKLSRTSSQLPSIRELAKDLGSSSMAVYRYFPSKEELTTALLDNVLSEIPLTESNENWRIVIKRFAINHRNSLESNPWAIPHLFNNPSPGINSTAIGEFVFMNLGRGGIKDEKAVAIFSGIIALNYGWVSFKLAKPKDFGSRFHEQLTQQAQNPISMPLTQAYSSHIMNFGNNRDYDLILSLILNGKY
jgi:AcrR family transcriptional regulator